MLSSLGRKGLALPGHLAPVATFFDIDPSFPVQLIMTASKGVCRRLSYRPQMSQNNALEGIQHDGKRGV